MKIFTQCLPLNCLCSCYLLDFIKNDSSDILKKIVLRRSSSYFYSLSCSLFLRSVCTPPSRWVFVISRLIHSSVRCSFFMLLSFSCSFPSFLFLQVHLLPEYSRSFVVTERYF